MVTLRQGTPIAKKYGKKNSDVEVPEGLSEEEKKQFLMAKGMSTEDKPKAEDKTDQTVSRVKYDEDLKQVKEKLKKKEEKIGELNKDREILRKDRDTFKARWERSSNDLIEEQKKTNSLKDELRKANEELEVLKKENKRLSTQTISVKVPEAENETKTKLKNTERSLKEINEKYNQLQSDNTQLRADNEAKDMVIAQLKENIVSFDEERARFEDTLALKDAEIESLREEPEIIQDQTSEIIAGTIVRKSPTELYSDLLEDGNYDVKLARSGDYMLIVPNVEGAAICVNRSIILPRLAELLPFAEVTSYKFTPAGNNILRVDFR